MSEIPPSRSSFTSRSEASRRTVPLGLSPEGCRRTGCRARSAPSTLSRENSLDTTMPASSGRNAPECHLNFAQGCPSILRLRGLSAYGALWNQERLNPLEEFLLRVAPARHHQVGTWHRAVPRASPISAKGRRHPRPRHAPTLRRQARRSGVAQATGDVSPASGGRVRRPAPSHACGARADRRCSCG
jgi:hypothetical protein